MNTDPFGRERKIAVAGVMAVDIVSEKVYARDIFGKG